MSDSGKRPPYRLFRASDIVILPMVALLSVMCLGIAQALWLPIEVGAIAGALIGVIVRDAFAPIG